MTAVIHGSAKARWPRTLAGAAAAALAACPATARADLPVEQFLRWNVQVQVAPGSSVQRAVAVTVVRQPGVEHAPFLLLLHGRPGSADGRIRMGRVEFPGNAQWFASRGYLVIVPTRIGYGVTGGPDIENTGPCSDKDYAHGFDMMVQESRELLRRAATLPGVDPRRGLVVGDSTGGVGALAVAAAGLPGVLGVVNFSGGDGGDPRRHIDHPCDPDRMASTVAAYGRTDRVPTLWLYSANDRYWGTREPRRWFDAFRAAGGRGRFVALPADKNNGHFIFNRNPQAWHGAFTAFSAALGLP